MSDDTALGARASRPLSVKVERLERAQAQVGDQRLRVSTINEPLPVSQGWHSRGYIPHFDRSDLVQTVTFRLADAMPAEKRAEWEQLLRIEDDVQRRQKLEAYLDAGRGSCALRDDRVAGMVEGALLFFDGQRYRLLAWAVMPNHVHVVMETTPGCTLASVLHSWKSFSAKEANKLLRRTGPFWEPEYWDRFVRDERHLKNAVNYVEQNPVKVGLVKRAEDWSYGSARLRGVVATASNMDDADEDVPLAFDSHTAGGTPALPGA